MTTPRSVLALPLNYSHRQEGQIRALRALHDRFEEFDYLGLEKTAGGRAVCPMFVDAVAHMQPDWVWMQLQETGIITADAIRQARERSPRTVFAHWMGDARREVPPSLAAICAATDVSFVSNAGQRALYEAAGAKRVEYLQIGLDWDDVLGIPAWTPPFRVPEVVLCGNYYGGRFPGTTDRVALVRALEAARMDVGIVGSGWPSGFPVVGSCHVKQQIHVYRQAKVALSVNHFHDIELCYSDRQLIAMASGTPVVYHAVPGIDREFNHSIHGFAYTDVMVAVGYVCMLLDDPELAMRIGDAGRAEVVRHHTWFNRMLHAMVIVSSDSRAATRASRLADIRARRLRGDKPPADLAERDAAASQRLSEEE
jgi:hypothetical protein